MAKIFLILKILFYALMFYFHNLLNTCQLNNNGRASKWQSLFLFKDNPMILWKYCYTIEYSNLYKERLLCFRISYTYMSSGWEIIFWIAYSTKIHWIFKNLWMLWDAWTFSLECMRNYKQVCLWKVTLCIMQDRQNLYCNPLMFLITGQR